MKELAYKEALISKHRERSESGIEEARKRMAAYNAAKKVYYKIIILIIIIIFIIRENQSIIYPQIQKKLLF